MSRKGQVSRGSDLFYYSDAIGMESESQAARRRRRVLKQACDLAYGIEWLESRVMLAADLWVGGGADNHWSTGANWARGVAPRPGDDLIFPVTARTTTTTLNDYAAGTPFNSIMLKGSGYAITGNAISLTTGITAANAPGAANADSVNLNITMASSQSILDGNAGASLTLGGTIDTGAFLTLTFDGSGSTVVNSTISGTGSIVKNGQGTATLNGANSYTGTSIINAGTLVISNNT